MDQHQDTQLGLYTKTKLLRLASLPILALFRPGLKWHRPWGKSGRAQAKHGSAQAAVFTMAPEARRG